MLGDLVQSTVFSTAIAKSQPWILSWVNTQLIHSFFIPFIAIAIRHCIASLICVPIDVDTHKRVPQIQIQIHKS